MSPGRQFYVYLHCKPDGTPFYVGKGHGNRCRDFKKGRSFHHKNVVRKHGLENVGVFVFQCDSEQQALQDEKAHIKQLRAEGYPLVNITEGGDGVTGLVHSKETRAKISAKVRGKKRGPCSEETKEKIRAAQIGRPRGPNPEHSARLKGRPLPETQKAAIGRAHTGQKRSAEARAAMSAAQRGHLTSEAARANLSAAHKGKKPSEETRRKMSEAQRLRWEKRKCRL